MSAAALRPVLYLHSSAGRYGADRQLAAIVGGLDRTAFRAIVVLAEDGPLVGDLRDLGAEVLVRPLAVLRRELMSAAGLARVGASFAADAGGLGRLARLHDVALVHTNTSVTLGGAATARIARVPHVWHVREIYAGFDRWWPTYRRLLLSADALPCVSEAVRAQFQGAPRDGRAEVVPDGLALDLPAVDRAEARRRLGLEPDAFVVALLGRLSRWKGQAVLVEALGRPPLARDGRTVAVLAGAAWREDPRMPEELRGRAAALGVEDQLRLPGFVDDVAALYAAADVVAVPSTQPDPLPNAALEAAAAGCCVVAADHGGLGEILRDGTTGLLVPPGDPGALAETLGALRDDPARRERLGVAARADVRERFGPAALGERLQELYARLIA